MIIYKYKLMEIEIPERYPLIVLGLVLTCIQCYFMSVVTVRGRVKHFNKDFLKKNFGREHIDAGLKSNLEKSLGFPDTGSGRYSDKLAY